MESLKSRKKSKSANNSPRDEPDQKRDPSPRIKIISSMVSDIFPSKEVVCPRCKTSKDVVCLGFWKKHDSPVYFCGTNHGDEKACRNVWMTESLHVQIDEVHMRYLPGPDGVYVITFT